jgi:hypothetical protein
MYLDDANIIHSVLATSEMPGKVVLGHVGFHTEVGACRPDPGPVKKGWELSPVPTVLVKFCIESTCEHVLFAKKSPPCWRICQVLGD